jgi:hypothetical protein
MSYFFSVEGSGDDPYGLANVVNFLAELPSQMMVTIGAGTLGADQVYIFQVVVTNFLGMTSTASLTVQTVQTSIPQVRYNSLVLLTYRGVLDIQKPLYGECKALPRFFLCISSSPYLPEETCFQQARSSAVEDTRLCWDLLTSRRYQPACHYF